MIIPGVSPVDPGRFRAHAANLGALSFRLSEIRSAGRKLARGQAAFGPLCGPVLAGLGDRVARHDGHMAYVEQTLRMMIDGLHRVADGEQELKEILRRQGDVAATDGTPVIDNPVRSHSGLMDSVIAEVHNRDWVQPQLAAAAPVAEFAAPVDEAYTALRIAGLQYAMTCVGPLRVLLDDLTGAPEVVAAQAVLWHRIGTDLHQVSDLLRECLDQNLPRRDRLDVRSYLALMTHNVEGLVGCAEIATAIAAIVKAAGELVLLTRDIVQGVIGNLFADVIVWAFDTSSAVSRAVMLQRLGTIVATSWRIRAYITALIASIIALSSIMDG